MALLRGSRPRSVLASTIETSSTPTNRDHPARLIAAQVTLVLARYRRRLFRGLTGGARPKLQASTKVLVACVIAEVAWRFAAAVACPRSEPAAALAPVSHTLMNGFFFSQGLAMGYSFGDCSRGRCRSQAQSYRQAGDVPDGHEETRRAAPQR